ncbi:MAG: efflux RND transporter periplasmic adaptor subunit [Nitrospirota bacterium]
MRKKVVAAGILAVVVALAVFLVYRFGGRQERSFIPVSGNVEVTEGNIGFKSSGRIVALPVEEGDSVKEGDRLAVLDSAELESQAAQQRASLQETRTKLQELRAGSRPQEIEQARAAVRAAEAEMVNAKRELGRADLLYKNGAISAQQMDRAQKAYDTAVAGYRKALESLSLAKEGPRREEIRAAQDRVQQAEASLSAAQERLKDTVLYAPIAGVVLNKNVELGETVAPGTPVYTIGDLANPWVKVYIREPDLGLVKLGQRAEITTDSYPGKVYEGVVSYIASEAEFTPKNVQTQEERVKLVFGVKVRVKNEKNELKPGMPADVRIMLQ